MNAPMASTSFPIPKTESGCICMLLRLPNSGKRKRRLTGCRLKALTHTQKQIIKIFSSIFLYPQINFTFTKLYHNLNPFSTNLIWSNFNIPGEKLFPVIFSFSIRGFFKKTSEIIFRSNPILLGSFNKGQKKT